MEVMVAMAVMVMKGLAEVLVAEEAEEREVEEAAGLHF